MKRYLLGTVTGFAAAALLAFFLHSVDAQVAQPVAVSGAGEAGLVEETITYRDARGMTARLAVPRAVVKIPLEYGQLTSITEGATTQTLWFVDPQGRVRNVTIGRQPVVIQFD